MKKIGVDLSPHQRRRLHNGHPVRVKKGEGILLVNPTNFDTLSRTFLRNKAKEIALSPEEIRANKLTSPEAHNQLREQDDEEVKLAPIQSAPAGRGFRKMYKAPTFESNVGGNRGQDSYLKDAGLGNLVANMKLAHQTQLGILTGKDNKMYADKPSIRGGRITGQVGVAGNLLSSRVLPPALQSQPFSANWGFANQLPPAYQKFSRGV
jgi:hypothetical protein